MARSVAIIHYDDETKQLYAIVPAPSGVGHVEHPIVKITTGPAVGDNGAVLTINGADVSWVTPAQPPPQGAPFLEQS